MPKACIPPEIQAEVQILIDEFNHQRFKKTDSVMRAFFGNKVKPGYSARFKGKYLYLDRNDHIKPSPICRLTWNGKMDDWGFAIYKYSRNQYDSEEWFFPGSGKVDGTVQGAMLAGMEAYEWCARRTLRGGCAGEFARQGEELAVWGSRGGRRGLGFNSENGIYYREVQPQGLSDGNLQGI